MSSRTQIQPSTPEQPYREEDNQEQSPHEPDTTQQDAYDGDSRLSPLEAQVLNEWARLRGNLDLLSSHLAELASQPSALISDNLRQLERKTTLVCTALKSSVYSIVLQYEGVGEGDGGEDEG